MIPILKKAASGALLVLLLMAFGCFSIQVFVLFTAKMDTAKRLGLSLNAVLFLAVATGALYLRLKIQGRTIGNFKANTKELVRRFFAGTLHMRHISGRIVSANNQFKSEAGVTVPLIKVQSESKIVCLENVVIPYHLHDLLDSNSTAQLFLVGSEAWGRKKHLALFACITNKEIEYHREACRDALKEVLIDTNPKIKNFGYGGATTMGDLTRIIARPLVRYFHFPSDRAMRSFIQEHTEVNRGIS